MRIADTDPVWKALQTRLAFLQTGRLLMPDLVAEQLETEASARALGYWHADAPDQLRSCPDEPMLVLVTGFESLSQTSPEQRCQQLANWRAAVQELLDRCGEARILLQSRVPKSTLGGCPGSQLIMDAAPAFIRPDEDAVVAEASKRSNLPRSELKQVSAWFDHRPGLVIAVAAAADSEAGRDKLLTDASKVALREYTAALEELGPDVLATVDHYVTELDRFEVDFSEIDGALVDALRGAALADVEDEGRSIKLLPGKDQRRMHAALRTVVDSTTQLPRCYLQGVEKLWVIERTLRAEVRRLLGAQYGEPDWKRHLPGGSELHRRVVSRAAQEAFPRAEACVDLPNPLEWMTLGELIDLVMSNDRIRPFEVGDAFWQRMRVELAPARDRIAHMRLLREGDEQTINRWRRQISRL